MDLAHENFSIFPNVSYSNELQWKYQSKTRKLHRSPSDIPLAVRLRSDLLGVKGRKMNKIHKNNIALKGHYLQFQQRRKFCLFSNRVAAKFLLKYNFAINWAFISPCWAGFVVIVHVKGSLLFFKTYVYRINIPQMLFSSQNFPSTVFFLRVWMLLTHRLMDQL